MASLNLGALRLRREELAICVAALLSKLLLDYGVPTRVRVPLSLIVSASFVGLTAKAGAGIEPQGLKAGNMPRGFLFGVAGSLPIIALVSAGLFAKRSRTLFEYAPGESKPLSGSTYELLVRIPFGTALPEEIIFRGAVLGLLRRNHDPVTSAGLSSVIFGLWHIAPALRSTRTREDPRLFRGLDWVGASLLTTTIAGYFFSWLRFRSQSVVAPWIAHTAANAIGLLGVRILAKQNEVLTERPVTPTIGGLSGQRSD